MSRNINQNMNCQRQGMTPVMGNCPNMQGARTEEHCRNSREQNCGCPSMQEHRQNMNSRAFQNERRNDRCSSMQESRQNMNNRAFQNERRSGQCSSMQEHRQSLNNRAFQNERCSDQCSSMQENRQNMSCRANPEGRDDSGCSSMQENMQNRIFDMIPTGSRKELLCFINEISFTVYDMLLYLDTHPCEQEALQYFREKNRLREKALKIYGEAYGPLTIATADDNCSRSWQWMEQPWPWEAEGGAC